MWINILWFLRIKNLKIHGAYNQFWTVNHIYFLWFWYAGFKILFGFYHPAHTTQHWEQK